MIFFVYNFCFPLRIIFFMNKIFFLMFKIYFLYLLVIFVRFSTLLDQKIFFVRNILSDTRGNYFETIIDIVPYWNKIIILTKIIILVIIIMLMTMIIMIAILFNNIIKNWVNKILSLAKKKLFFSLRNLTRAI